MAKKAQSVSPKKQIPSPLRRMTSSSRRSARFSAALNRRQDAALDNIAQHPESRAAKAYARATVPAFA